jgi:hypothetical protein
MTFLRRVLFTDAATCLAMGLALLLLAQPAAPLLGLPPTLLEIAGAALLPIAAFIGWSAISGRLLRLVVAGNVAWVLASAALLLGGWVSPTALGYGFVIVQAVVVAVLAAVEYAGVRSA